MVVMHAANGSMMLLASTFEFGNPSSNSSVEPCFSVSFN